MRAQLGYWFQDQSRVLFVPMHTHPAEKGVKMKG